jgi:geranylgeranyl reductase family protein
VIVIGAGPAGSSCAHALATQGIRVALVDRKVFPREKLCGGLLSERARRHFVEIFGERGGPTIQRSVMGADFYAGDRYLNGAEGHRPIYFTARKEFDAYLLRLAEGAGARAFLGRELSSIGIRPVEARLRDGTVLRADFLIGADGVNSRVGRELFQRTLSKRDLALGLGIELPIEQARRMVYKPTVYFSVVRWGYGWVFPKSATLTIGVGGLLAKNPDLKRRFGEFLRLVCRSLPNVPWKGHYVPFGSCRRRPGHDHVLLIGDAAGLVEPVTGEGIAFALRSAQLAAQAVVASAAAGKPGSALGNYLPGYGEIASSFAQARRLRNLIFPALSQQIFLHLLPRSRNAIPRYLDLLAGEIDYADYLRYLRKAALGRTGSRR